jgi:hypothetical protein
MGRDARQANGTVGYGGLASKVVLPDIDDPPCLGHDQVQKKASEKIYEYKVHPKVVGGILVVLAWSRGISTDYEALMTLVIVRFVHLFAFRVGVVHRLDDGEGEEERYEEELDGHFEECEVHIGVQAGRGQHLLIGNLPQWYNPAKEAVREVREGGRYVVLLLARRV